MAASPQKHSDCRSLWAGPSLVIDSSTGRTQVGILRNGQWVAYTEIQGEALETIFSGVMDCLGKSGLQLAKVKAVAIGVGPGSILGLRLALMAVETWRQLHELRHWQLFQFHGLEVQARILIKASSSDFHLLTDFRGGSWHHLEVSEGQLGTMDILSEDAVRELEGAIYYSPGGRGRAVPPSIEHEEKFFSLQSLPELAPLDWATPVEKPTLYLPSPPVFRKWDAQPHRQPSTP